jgi:hypothetical protein
MPFGKIVSAWVEVFSVRIGLQSGAGRKKAGTAISGPQYKSKTGLHFTGFPAHGHHQSGFKDVVASVTAFAREI